MDRPRGASYLATVTVPRRPLLAVLLGSLLGPVLGIALVGCQRDVESLRPPAWPPGQPPPGYAQPHAYPGQPPVPRPALGSAWTPFGELLSQLPQIAAHWPPLPTLADLPQIFPGWAWPTPPGPTPPGPAPPATTPPATTPPPPSTGWPAQWVAFEDDVLRLTNERRAFGAVCGTQSFGPAPPVAPHPQLRQAARGHANDMAQRNYFDHRSPEGTGPMQRAVAAGYSGGFVGENIAAGQTSPAAVVQDWIDSPGHCLNLMDPRFRYLGVGFVLEQGDQYGEYWVQNFGG